MKNPLLMRFGKDKRWVTWKLEERKGKKTKIPFSLNGRMASSTDEKTWSTYEQIVTKHKNVGIVFTPEKTLLGIDLDKCLPLKDDMILQLIAEAETYTEVSPSGNGLHLYLELTEPLKLVANRSGAFEAYTEGRYFTVTGDVYKPAKPIRLVTPEEALKLLAIIGYPWGKKKTTNSFDDMGAEDGPVKSNSPKVKPKTELIDHPADILERMFAASNGDEIRKLYEGDISAYGKDGSRADMALLAHLAFWTQKDAAKMEAIWLASPLGQREKTQARQDYRDRSINAAIDNCTEVYTPSNRGTSTVKIGDASMDLLYMVKDKSKIFYKNTENMSRVINKHPDFAGSFRFDAYRDIVERKVNGVWRPMEDWDAVDIQTKISVLFSDFANIGKDTVYDAIMKVAYDHTIDSGADYLRSLVWDKTPRLNSWISKAYHTADDDYHQSIGANWVKGMVKRIIHPGCKFDYVLVLEGEQGIRKSTSLLTLAGELGHVETTMSTEQKDFFMQFLGNAIVEFSEGETLSRTETKRLKAIITVQIDKFRAPYGRAIVPHPRRCVFAMTTNQSEYLKDETGNRRWLPVAVIGNVDLKWIEENREQVLAEAYARVMAGESTWEFPEEEMALQQSLRRIQDPNADPVVNWYMQHLTPRLRDEGVTVDDAFKNALNAGFSGPIPRLVEMGICDIFKSVLKLEKRRGMLGGIRQTKWYPTVQSAMAVKLVEQHNKGDDNF